MSMSGSESDYRPDALTSREPSIDDDEGDMEMESAAPSPSRKRRRRRSSSAEDYNYKIPAVRYDLQGHYKDAYRTLFNDTVTSAAARIAPDESFHPRTAQMGASIWTSDEKNMYFAALERLGRDHLPGIARAIGTKSVPEVRHFSLLLEDAAAEQENTRVAHGDIPAAAEISAECSQRLELAGDALAWYQEKFEAKREQAQYGDHWLITPDIAMEIETAHGPSRRPSVASETEGEEVSKVLAVAESVPLPQILQDIPEATLLVPANFLKLCETIFMNPCPSVPSMPPHWTALVSPLASKPAIYRTSLIDFHTLAVSLTKRLTQAAIIQSTSRLRAQGWRTKHGVTPLVKKRDVYTAIDMLNLERNGRERWRRVARRCGLRVFEGSGANKRDVDWNEAELLLAPPNRSRGATTDDDETTAAESDADEHAFRARAMRSGTPRPSRDDVRDAYNSEHDTDHGSEAGEDEDTDDSFDAASATSGESMGAPGDTDDADEPDLLEKLDENASRQEEHALWTVLGVSPPTPLPPSTSTTTTKTATNVNDGEDNSQSQPHPPCHTTHTTSAPPTNDWRTYTPYRPEWRALDGPVSPAAFHGNAKSDISMALPSTPLDDVSDVSTAEEAQYSGGGRRGKRRKVAVAAMEIPMRGARAYAALRDDGADWAAPSIEVGADAEGAMEPSEVSDGEWEGGEWEG